MNISKKNDESLARLNEIINRIYAEDIEYFEITGDRMFADQPYVIQLYLSYRNEISREALGEIIKISHVVWEYFYTNEQVKYVTITEEQAAILFKKNYQMLTYFEGELARGQGHTTLESSIIPIKNKALLVYVFAKMSNCETLSKIDIQIRGSILVDFQSLIECFEENE